MDVLEQQHKEWTEKREIAIKKMEDIEKEIAKEIELLKAERK